MATYSDVFARTEMKYRLQAAQLEALLPILDTHMTTTDFDDAHVRSLYYDTPSYDLIARSIESPLYKEKLRLRVYGNEISGATPAFVEIKKKYKGIVYKRRVALSLAGAKAFLNGMPYEKAHAAYPLVSEASNDKPNSQDICNTDTTNRLSNEELATLANSAKSRQIANEIAFFIQRYGRLVPSILTVCERQSLVDALESDLRITIDTHLQTKTDPADIGDTQSLTPLIPDSEAIMEIKTTFGLPLWLAEALSDVHAYKQSFSKCGTAYAQIHRNKSSTIPLHNSPVYGVGGGVQAASTQKNKNRISCGAL